MDLCAACKVRSALVGLLPMVALALTLAPPAQSADGLQWSAPNECPTGSEVVARSRELGLGEDAVVTARAEVRRVDDGYELAVVLQQDAPPRIVRDADCAVLADAAAIMVALSSDPIGVVQHVRETEATSPKEDEVAESESESQPAPEPEPEPKSEPTEPSQARRSVAAGPGKRVRFGLRLAGAIGGGALPGVNPGASVGLAAFGDKARGWSWRVEAGWLHWFPRRKQFEDFEDVTGDFRLTGGYLRAGPSFRRKRLSVPILAGIDLGALTALTRTQGFPDTEGPTQLWAATTLGAAVAWEPVSPLTLWLGADMVVPLRSYSFAITGLGLLHEVWAVGVRSVIGIEIRFP